MTESEIHTIAAAIARELRERDGVRWMKLRPAARYSSIGEQRLKRLAETGAITGFPDPDSGRGDWIFDRHSLDDYRLNQAGEAESRALEIMGTIG